MPGIEQQDGGGHHLLVAEYVATAIGGQHVAEQVFGRALATLLDRLGDKIHEVLRGLVGVQLGLVADPEHVHGHHAIGPRQQLRCAFGRKSDHFGDDDGGNRRRERLDEVNTVLALEAVDHLVGQTDNARPQLLDMPRHESPVHQRAQPCVSRWLEVEQGMLLGQVERCGVGLGFGHAELLARCHMQDFPAEALVPQQGIHILEAGKAPVAILLPEEGRVVGMELVIEGIGVLIEGRIARIGAGAPGVGNVGNGLELEDGGHGNQQLGKGKLTLRGRRDEANGGDALLPPKKSLVQGQEISRSPP
jgi:hypothetical protein